VVASGSKHCEWSLGGGHMPHGGVCSPKENHNYDGKGAGEQGDKKEGA
jgi:hypothetical protein